MRFTGTHIPGQHRLVAQNPPQIVIPERKITSTEEAAKWHASRGGAAPEEEDGGATPVLLPGLVGWALTSGPQQTLSSAGVVASGPNDWTEQTGGGGSLSYSASGVIRSDAGSAVLTQPLAGPLVIGDQDFFFSAQFGISDDGSGVQIDYDNFWESFLGVGVDTPPAQVSSVFYDVSGNYQSVLYTPSSYGTQFVYDLWYDHATDTLSSSINAAAPQTTLLVGGMHAPDASSEFRIVPSSLGVNLPICRVRYVIGDISAWVASRVWRANSGNGRTDAEIAAYTG